MIVSSAIHTKRKKDSIFSKLRNIKTYYLKVGIPYGKHNHTDQQGKNIDVAIIGYIHEFGCESRRIPERSFLRGWLEEKQNEIKQKQIGLLKKLVRIEEFTEQQALGELGEFAKSGIIKRIRNRIAPPLSLKTERGRKNEIPLMDTGQLYRAIDYQICKKGEG